MRAVLIRAACLAVFLYTGDTLRRPSAKTTAHSATTPKPAALKRAVRKPAASEVKSAPRTHVAKPRPAASKLAARKPATSEADFMDTLLEDIAVKAQKAKPTPPPTTAAKSLTKSKPVKFAKSSASTATKKLVRPASGLMDRSAWTPLVQRAYEEALQRRANASNSSSENKVASNQSSPAEEHNETNLSGLPAASIPELLVSHENETGSVEPIAKNPGAERQQTPETISNDTVDSTASDQPPPTAPVHPKLPQNQSANASFLKVKKNLTGKAKGQNNKTNMTNVTRVTRTTTTTAPPPPAINASGGENVCQKIGFVSIQKTGTSTTYWRILPEMAKRQRQNYKEGHVNYRQAMHRVENRSECLFTILRDPVDRFLSEFAMSRGTTGWELFNSLWDWHEDDMDWLFANQHEQNLSKALLEYLHNPNNPTRNRQALYLLGFDHVTACREWLGNHVKKCPHKESAYPAHTYDWDKNPDDLLAEAKAHLLSLRSFGMTDCYEESLQHIAVAMGWDPAATVDLAQEYQERWGADDKRLIYYPLHQKVEHDVSKSMGMHTMSHFVSPELEAEIRRVNSVDVKLVEFARQLLVERGLTTCARN